MEVTQYPPSHSISPKTQSDDAAIDAVRSQFQHLTRTITCLSTLFGRMPQLVSLREPYHFVAKQVAALAHSTSEEVQVAHMIAVTQRNLGALAARVMEIDASIPMAAFRPVLAQTTLTPEYLASYARMLVAARDTAPERRDRIEYIATRIALDTSAIEQPAYRATSEILEDYEIFLGDFHAADAVVEEAVAYLREAELRAAQIQVFTDIFESGLFVTTRTYKLGLGDAALEPRILLATARFNGTMRSVVGVLARRDGISPDEITTRFNLAHEEIALMSLNTDAVGGVTASLPAESEVAVSVSIPEVHSDTSVAPSVRTIARAGWTALLRAIAILAALITGAVTLALADPPSNMPIEASRATLETVSGLLGSATMTRGTRNDYFIGYVDAQRWARITPEAQVTELRRIRERLEREGIWTGTILNGDDILSDWLAGVEFRRPVPTAGKSEFGCAGPPELQSWDGSSSGAP